jgi:hypothetical protein
MATTMDCLVYESDCDLPLGHALNLSWTLLVGCLLKLHLCVIRNDEQAASFIDGSGGSGGTH